MRSISATPSFTRWGVYICEMVPVAGRRYTPAVREPAQYLLASALIVRGTSGLL